VIFLKILIQNVEKIGDDFAEIIFQTEDDHKNISLHVMQKNKNWSPTSMYFLHHPDEWTCPTCKKEHWNDDSMKCIRNENEMKTIWSQIQNEIQLK
jgi:hypothetical protein